MSLDRESLIAYRERWEAVASVERAERRNRSVAARWRKLNALLRMAQELGLDLTTDPAQIEADHKRWNELRAMYAASAKDDLG